MRFLLACIAFYLATSAPTQAEDRRTNTTRLRVMSFNAEFLWDGVEPEEGNVNFDRKGKQAECEAHMAKIADVIKAQDPDVVCLVEVEGIAALTTLNDKFLLGRGYKPYLEQGNDTSTGQDVGMLTRIDPISYQYDSRPGTSGNVTKSISKNFVAEIEANDTRIALVGLHLLAQPGSQGRKHQRQAQADAARQIALEKAEQGCDVIILGDINDYDRTVKDHVSSTPITNVVNTLRMMESGDFTDDLKSVAEKIPQDKRFTSHWDKDGDGDVDAPDELTSIDHILVSPTLFGLLDEVKIAQDHDPSEVSDHFPIVATLKFTDGSPDTPGPLSLAGRAARISRPALHADRGANREQAIQRIEALERELAELKRLLREQ